LIQVITHAADLSQALLSDTKCQIQNKGLSTAEAPKHANNSIKMLAKEPSVQALAPPVAQGCIRGGHQMLQMQQHTEAWAKQGRARVWQGVNMGEGSRMAGCT